jgi:hypothetical protein
MGTRSLFIISLPRSLSMRVYGATRDALGLAGPRWAVGGEVLNHDLLAMSRWPKLLPSGHKYLTPETAPERVRMLHAYLDDVTQPEGRIYKDVVQPFVLASWAGLSRFAILKIRRDLVEVVHALLERGWHYPKDALAPGDPLRSSAGMRVATHYAWAVLGQRALRTRAHGRLTARLCEDAVIKGLVLAERALDGIPGPCVDYRDLIRDERALRDTLQALYPDVEVGPVRYVDDAFTARRRLVARGLSPARRRALGARIERIRQETCAAVPRPLATPASS